MITAKTDVSTWGSSHCVTTCPTGEKELLGGVPNHDFGIMAPCLLLESDSPEFKFQFHHWLNCEASGRLLHFSVSETSHNKMSLIAVSTSQSGCEDNACKSLDVNTKYISAWRCGDKDEAGRSYGPRYWLGCLRLEKPTSVSEPQGAERGMFVPPSPAGLGTPYDHQMKLWLHFVGNKRRLGLRKQQK